MALRLVHPKDKNSYEDLFQRALAWQLSFQCRDGGWAAFDKDVIDGWLENMPFADHNAILDPTCSDLTARTLELFGYINFDRHDASVETAIRYLIATQEDDGSWYGRWGVNYIYGTWQVLRGLRAIGQDMTQDWILRGRDWLEELSERRRRLGRNVCHIRRSFGQRKGRKHCFTDVLGNHGHLRVWRSQSGQHTTRVALSSFDPTGGWVVERTANHRHRFSQGVLLKIRHIRQNFRSLRSLPA